MSPYDTFWQIARRIAQLKRRNSVGGQRQFRCIGRYLRVIRAMKRVPRRARRFKALDTNSKSQTISNCQIPNL